MKEHDNMNGNKNSILKRQRFSEVKMGSVENIWHIMKLAARILYQTRMGQQSLPKSLAAPQFDAFDVPRHLQTVFFFFLNF